TAEPETSEPSHLGQENRNLKVSESRGRVDQNHCASSPHQEAPLSYVFSQYLSRLPAGARRSVQFHFDGSKVAGSQTAAQLDFAAGSVLSGSETIKPSGVQLLPLNIVSL
uniref:Rad60/SUMO-like domain-containing protein n=1 Tax=Xiphophorus couchianus TaxID=32473 RepID=A0A3B5LVJ7_9TELE